MRSVAELLHHLPVSLDHGLAADAVPRSRQEFGANRLTPLPRAPLWKKFLEKFDEPIIKILLAAALLSMIVDQFQPPWDTVRYLAGGVVLVFVCAAVAVVLWRGRSEEIPTLLFGAALVIWPIGLLTGHPSYDGLAVMIAIVLATGVAFFSEYRSDREFEILNADKESQQVKVTRDGGFHTIPLEEVVVGDLVSLEMGDEIPADGRVVKANDLYVDQSLMTGESEPVHKKVRPQDETAEGPDQPGCLYRGTQIADGAGHMLVTAVGDATELGRIAHRLAAPEEAEAEADGTAEDRVKRRLTISKELTPLQQKLTQLAGVISRVGYVAAGAIFLALLIRGAFFVEPREVYLPHTAEQAAAVAGTLLHYFMYMVIIIVVAVPEGLPMSVTVSLAMAMQKMTRANSLVRQLVACETVGSTTVICSDKTGTLTQNKMQVVRLFLGGQRYDRGTASWLLPAAETPWPRGDQPGNALALNAACNSTANLEQKNGALVPIGNSTEGALLLWLKEAGLEYGQLRQQFPPVYQLHFSSERKRMTTVIRYGERLLSLVKGAPEWLLEQSTRYLAADGSVQEWTPEARSTVQAELQASAAQAMRTLGFGQAVLPPDTTLDEDTLHEHPDLLERGLVFLGFVAIRDPLREDVKEAVARCRQAGIEVKMITGDNIETARAIGHDVGLLDRPDAVVQTSAEFNALNDDELRELLPRLRVLARARPLDKYRMVRLLQDRKEVVAVTGDGTNDAPALKRADVGLAMGIAGTEVAKEASKIVLLDDAFSTIVKAVHWGRSLYENIQRFLQFQLTINVSALVIAFLGPFLGVKPPFTILQLLWINVIMDTFAAIALCSEPPRPGLMTVPPKRRDESILTRSMLVTIFSTAAFFVVVMLGLLAGMEFQGWFRGDGPLSTEFPELTLRQVSLFFTIYVFFQVWNEINCRSLVPDVSGFRGLFKNLVFLGIVALTVLGQVVIVTFGGRVFQAEPLSLQDWLWIALGTATVLIFAEVVRRVRLALRSG